MSFRDRLARVEETIARAASRSGRRRQDVILVAVTKGSSLEVVREAFDAGLRIFGENRVQEASGKVPGLPQAEWHLIGHLQTNKVRAALPLFRMVQSVDSFRLAEALSAAALAGGSPMRVLLEVNVSGEIQKQGFTPDGFDEAAGQVAGLPGLRVEGLMGMAPLEGGEAAARKAFSRLRTIRDGLSRLGDPRLAMRFLSMGMSGDLEAAIEEGSNMVRVGRALFA